MPALAIVGAQWGDEGKGKVVDLLAESADVVVRTGGGANAGHTLVVGGERIVLRLVPSGVLHPHTSCVLAQGMVLDLGVLLEELGLLAHRGVELDGRLAISDRAHLILPVHALVDALRESAAVGTKIGTTRRGIGPCYEDKVGRRGVRMGDLRRPEHLRARVGEVLAHWAPIVERLGGALPELAATVEPLLGQAERLLPFVTDTSLLLEQQLDRDARVLFEGAQGTLLDVDHGTYPFVTSSSAVAGGVCTGAGVGPTRLRRVLGITKAYTTRVGAGPFPTELHDAAGLHLRQVGVEFGSVTGRPRSTGWLDLPALRYARRVNGLGSLAVTKLDVLAGLDELCVCVAYDTPSGRTTAFPLGELDQATPVYERLPGWSAPIAHCRRLDQLPRAARDYLAVVERDTGLPLGLVSVGASREETIVLDDPFG
jgi:adenylosuccinate synthase